MFKRFASPALAAVLVAFSMSSFANGRMEDTRQSFYHEVNDAYNDTVKFLEDGNTMQGAEAAKRLATLTGRLYSSLEYLEKSAHDLSPQLEEAWRPAMSAFGAFNTSAQQLQMIVGQKDHRDFLRVLKETWVRTGEAWEKSYEKMKAFGEQFNKMCETCR